MVRKPKGFIVISCIYPAILLSLGKQSLSVIIFAQFASTNMSLESLFLLLNSDFKTDKVSLLEIFLS